MTGEITLTGRILAVGGINEKLLGAERSGLKRICLPEDNRADYDEIDERLKKEFDSVDFFSEYNDLYQHIFKDKIQPVPKPKEVDNDELEEEETVPEKKTKNTKKITKKE